MFPLIARSRPLASHGTAHRVTLAAIAVGGHLAAASWLDMTVPETRQPTADAAPITLEFAEPLPAATLAPRSSPPSPRPSTPTAAAARVAVRSAGPSLTAPAEKPAPPAAASATGEVPVAPAAASSSSPPAIPEKAVLVPARFDADYLSNPKPVYPPLARRLGEQGKVLLRVSVGAHGLPESIDVKTSSNSRRLDEAALEAVRRWRFVPARQGDTPISSWVTVPVVFSLEG